MSSLVTNTAPPGATLAGLEPLRTLRSRWPTAIGAVLTVLMVVGLTRQLFDRGLHGLTEAAPASPVFYLFFALFYLSLPVGDFLIYRRLWGVPADGLLALIRKRIANDALVNYSGEAYFYAWARQRTRLVAAPFGAIKDVSILSAMAGNALTLLLVVFALPFGRGLLTPDQFRQVLWSVAILIAISSPFLLFSRRVFSLPRHQLWAVFGIHCGRVIASNLLTVLAWHFAMPDISIAMWLMLVAGKMLVFRLPMIPNKEVLFPLIANMLIGGALVQHLVFFGALTLVTNVVLLGAFALHDVVRKSRTL